MLLRARRRGGSLVGGVLGVVRQVGRGRGSRGGGILGRGLVVVRGLVEEEGLEVVGEEGV